MCLHDVAAKNLVSTHELWDHENIALESKEMNKADNLGYNDNDKYFKLQLYSNCKTKNKIK